MARKDRRAGTTLGIDVEDIREVLSRADARFRYEVERWRNADAIASPTEVPHNSARLPRETDKSHAATELALLPRSKFSVYVYWPRNDPFSFNRAAPRVRPGSFGGHRRLSPDRRCPAAQALLEYPHIAIPPCCGGCLAPSAPLPPRSRPIADAIRRRRPASHRSRSCSAAPTTSASPRCARCRGPRRTSPASSNRSMWCTARPNARGGA